MPGDEIFLVRKFADLSKIGEETAHIMTQPEERPGFNARSLQRFRRTDHDTGGREQVEHAMADYSNDGDKE